MTNQDFISKCRQAENSVQLARVFDTFDTDVMEHFHDRYTQVAKELDIELSSTETHFPLGVVDAVYNYFSGRLSL